VSERERRAQSARAIEIGSKRERERESCREGGREKEMEKEREIKLRVKQTHRQTDKDGEGEREGGGERERENGVHNLQRGDPILPIATLLRLASGKCFLAGIKLLLHPLQAIELPEGKGGKERGE